MDILEVRTSRLAVANTVFYSAGTIISDCKAQIPTREVLSQGAKQFLQYIASVPSQQLYNLYTILKHLATSEQHYRKTLTPELVLHIMARYSTAFLWPGCPGYLKLSSRVLNPEILLCDARFLRSVLSPPFGDASMFESVYAGSFAV